MGYSPPNPSRATKIVATVLLGLAFAGLLLFFAGVGQDNSRLFGVPLGYQSPPQPPSDWSFVLASEADARGLKDWSIEPFEPGPRLGYTMAPRQAFYTAVLKGSDGKRVAVKMVAPEGGQWVVTEWRER